MSVSSIRRLEQCFERRIILIPWYRINLTSALKYSLQKEMNNGMDDSGYELWK